MNSFQTGIICLSIFIVSVFNTLFAQSLDKINWKDDLEIYKTSLEQKHIDIYHSITKDDFTNEWQKIYNNVESLSDFEIILKLMRLTRRINDGHTAVSLRNMLTYRFPFEIEWIEDKWYVVKTLNKNKKILKTTLESINGIPSDTVTQKISEIAQFVENEYSIKDRTGSYVTIAELLFNLNLINSTNEATFSFRNNKELIQLNLNTITNDIWENSNLSIVTLTVPEITQPNGVNRDLWFALISNTKAVYINFESYPTFEEMQVFGEQLVTYIQENQIKKVIIDMRKNGGGDLYVGTVLAYALNLADSIDWKNGVFVLTSNKTFSAATSNAALFKQLLNAKVIGQPTGSNPNGYQDMDSFILPNSKLVITYSKRLFRLSNQLNTALQPDIIINQKKSDLLQNIDTVLRVLVNRFIVLN
ncbi:S41 family peptidase [Algibacter pacificus]|uniref:S41 family peptidase n=1 Tax=Algibacter pacificus TaxID=2599389 RepID=UPI0011CC6074|nr:S41 family peptidase [Algibacter pacificus]